MVLANVPNAQGGKRWAMAVRLTAALLLGASQPIVADTYLHGLFRITFPQESMPIEQWMRAHQWESRRHEPQYFEVGRGHMRLVSKGDSVMIGTTRGMPLRSQHWPRLRLRLQIIKNPTGTNNAEKSGDDSAFRLYVAFNRDKILFGPPHTIVYVWTERTEANTFIESPYFSEQMRYLSIGKGTTGSATTNAGGWVTIERDLVADYRKSFPTDEKDVPDVGGILLKCDSNNTDTSAEALLASIEFLAPNQ